MSAELAWGSPYFVGSTQGPVTTPFTLGNSGTVTDHPGDGFSFASLAFSIVGDTAAVVTIYFTPQGGSLTTRDSYSVSPGDFNNTEAARYQPGMIEIVGVAGGIPLAKKLVAIVANDDGGDYGSLAWYEEDLAPVVSEFWTRFKNTREVLA